MGSVTIKGISKPVVERLKQEAEANSRSLNQEILARLERSLEIDASVRQNWIDEALASGPATPLRRRELDAVRDRVLRRRELH